MTPAAARARYRVALEKNPETATFARDGDSAVVHVRSLGSPHDAVDLLTETVEQPMIRLLALTEDFELESYPVPPRRGDEVTWRGRSRRVEKVLDGRDIGGTFIAYELIVVG